MFCDITHEQQRALVCTFRLCSNKKYISKLKNQKEAVLLDIEEGCHLITILVLTWMK